MMAAGTVAGMNHIQLPNLEAGIAASVAVLRLLIAYAVRMQAWAGAGLVSLFAVLHGHAHGLELPAGTSPLLYGSGFMTATLLLHLAGVVAGMLASRNAEGKVMRYTGAGIAAAGALLLVGAA